MLGEFGDCREADGEGCARVGDALDGDRAACVPDDRLHVQEADENPKLRDQIEQFKLAVERGRKLIARLLTVSRPTFASATLLSLSLSTRSSMTPCR